MEKERRQHPRVCPEIEISGFFELKSDLVGKFPNHIPFQVRNISLGGFNILSSFVPELNGEYDTTLTYREKQYSLKIRVTNMALCDFLAQPDPPFAAGARYALGCQFIDPDENRQQLIRFIIQNDCTPQK